MNRPANRHLPIVHDSVLRSKVEMVSMAKRPVGSSMSGTDLFLKCQYWASPTTISVPESNEISQFNEALRFGRAFHKTIEIYLESRGRKKPKFQIIADRFSIDAKRLEHFYRRAVEYIDVLIKELNGADDEWLIERKMVYDPFADTSRYLTSTKERDYSDRRPWEIPGTGDFILVPKSTHKPFVVIDWKSGQSNYDAEDNGQLLSLSLGMSRIVPHTQARVFIVRIDEEWIEPSEGLLQEKQWTKHRQDLAVAIENALSLTPSMRSGAHCTKYYCRAIEVCPAHAGPLSLRDAIDGVLTPEQRGHQYSRYQAAKKLIEKIGDFWHRDIAMNGSITLDNGSEVILKQKPRENLSKASIRRAMNLVDAEAIIKQLDTAGAIDKTINTELFVKPSASSKK